jgi:hypothetical protein
LNIAGVLSSHDEYLIAVRTLPPFVRNITLHPKDDKNRNWNASYQTRDARHGERGHGLNPSNLALSLMR